MRHGERDARSRVRGVHERRLVREVLHPENAEARGEGADAVQACCGERGRDDDVVGDGEVAAVCEWGGGEGERGWW